MYEDDHNNKCHIHHYFLSTITKCFTGKKRKEKKKQIHSLTFTHCVVKVSLTMQCLKRLTAGSTQILFKKAQVAIGVLLYVRRKESDKREEMWVIQYFITTTF